MAETTLAIPVHNSGAFLDDLFACLSRLDPAPDEIIFLDDASGDDSYRRLQEFLASEACKASLRILRHERNLGVAHTYNRLVREARSEWVQLLDADDVLVEPDFYQRIAAELENDDNAAVIAALESNSQLLHLGARIVSRLIPPRLPHWLPVLGTAATRSGVVYRRNVLAALPFPDPAWPGSDIVHLLGLRKARRCAFVRSAHVRYRIHPGAQSGQARDHSRFREEIDRFDLPTRLAHRFDLRLRRAGQRLVR